MKKLFLLLLLLSFSPGIHSETQVIVSVSSTTATIGERITLKFIVRTDTQSSSIKLSQGKPEFEFIEEDELSISKEDGLRTFEKNFKISFFKTGEFNVGPFDIGLMNDGSVIENLVSNTIPVNIRSVLNEEDKDIKPLKDLSEIEGNPFHLLKYFLIALFIAVTVFLVLYFIRRRKKGKVKAEIPPLPPEEEFRNRIESLWRSDFLKTGKTKKFFLNLSESYKLFMTRLYRFNAEDLTTYEIIRNLKDYEENKKVTENFDPVFLISDLAKFAKYTPSETEIEETRKKLFKIIELIGARRKKEEEEINAAL